MTPEEEQVTEAIKHLANKDADWVEAMRNLKQYSFMDECSQSMAVNGFVVTINIEREEEE